MKLRMLLPLFLLLSACSSSPDKKPVSEPAQEETTTNNPTADKGEDCITGEGALLESDHHYQIVLHNKCDSEFGGFTVEVRFFDSTNARIGWTQTQVHAIGKQETVKWTEEIDDDEIHAKDGKTSKVAVEFIAMNPKITLENK